LGAKKGVKLIAGVRPALGVKTYLGVTLSKLFFGSARVARERIESDIRLSSSPFFDLSSSPLP
jgi:hypothetical protein